MGKPHWSNLEVIICIQTRHDNAERKNIRSLLNCQRHDFSFKCAKNEITERLSNKWRIDKNKSSSLRLEAHLHLIFLGINTMCRTNVVVMHKFHEPRNVWKTLAGELRIYEPSKMSSESLNLQCLTYYNVNHPRRKKIKRGCRDDLLDERNSYGWSKVQY